MQIRRALGTGWLEYDSAWESPGVLVGDRLLPPQVDVTLPGIGDQPTASLTLVVQQGVPQCRSVTLASSDSGRDVRSSDLRGVKVDDLVQHAFAMVALKLREGLDGRTWLQAVDETPEGVRSASKAVEVARRRSRRKITPALLKRVAEVYRAHLDDRPVEAVRATFQVSYRTAAGYVERARRDGHLPQTTAGKRRG